jgi:hypothetical protein
LPGVPAKRIGWMSRSGEWLVRYQTCPRDSSRYRQVAADRLEEEGP